MKYGSEINDDTVASKEVLMSVCVCVDSVSPQTVFIRKMYMQSWDILLIHQVIVLTAKCSIIKGAYSVSLHKAIRITLNDI